MWWQVKKIVFLLAVAESETWEKLGEADRNSLELGKIIENALVIPEKNMYKSNLIGE